MHKRSFGAIGVTAVTAAAFLATPAGAQTNPFYKGKTVQILVGLRVGGTVDTFARGFSRYLTKHVPGAPVFIIRNMPGGGGMIATNYLAEKAKPDGMTIMWGPWDPLSQALKYSALRAKYSDFAFIGGTGDVRVDYCRTDTIPGGVKKPEDIAKAKMPVIIGASSAAGLQELLTRLSFRTLQIPHRVIIGYRGGSAAFLALQRGETQCHNTSIGTFRTRSKDFIASGEGAGIAYHVPVAPDGKYTPNKYIKEMPPFPELYKRVHGKAPSGPDWKALNWLTNQIADLTFIMVAPKGTPLAAVDAMREGYKMASNDPQFIAETIKTNQIPFSFVDVPTGEEIFRSLKDVSPDIVATLKAVVEERTESAKASPRKK